MIRKRKQIENMDSYYIIGLIEQYIRSNRIAETKWKRENPNFVEPKIYKTHSSILKSSCKAMIAILKTRMVTYYTWEDLFEEYIYKLDEWSCKAKTNKVGMVFSTGRDAIIDLKDYISAQICYRR